MLGIVKITRCRGGLFFNLIFSYSKISNTEYFHDNLFTSNNIKNQSCIDNHESIKINYFIQI